LDFYYLLDAKTEGRIVILRFYHAQAGEILEISDSDYKPYFFLPHQPSKADEEEIRSLYGEVEVVKKRYLFTDELKELTKVTVYTPEAVRRASKTFKTVWETEIGYAQSYVYDNNLVFGAPYKMIKNQLVLVTSIPQELETRFEETFAEMKTADPQKYAQTKQWFNLLHQPVPKVKPEESGIKETNPERLHHAFSLARIVNIPVAEAYHSRRVSDWLKSMIYAYLRKNNVLIPMSTELRRGLETHRVQGALTIQPKAGVYFNTVVCDFESLYPSCVDNHNLSYETVNCPHKECRTNRIRECEQHWVCTKRRGFYSVLIGALKDLRIRWFKPLSKNMAVSEQERKTAQVLVKLLKMISVSSYGVTVRIHGLACPPLAECITGYGRWALQTTWDMAEAKGLYPTYGDTDSVFLDNPQLAQVEWLIRTVKEKLKLDLAIEKQYSLCVLPQAKKAYFGILLDGKPDIKGLTAIKSNSPRFIQRVFQDCVKKLSHVKTLEDYELAKKRIIAVVRQAVSELENRRIQLEDLVYSVKLYFNPKERLATDVKVTPQPYECAVQLLDMGEKVDRSDIVRFIKVKPFNYKGKTFIVKPVQNVKSVKEINVKDYVRNMTTAFEQTFAPMGIRLQQKPETKISDWFEKSLPH
jgi:DNA polymerase elongation subunit (family B)